MVTIGGIDGNISGPTRSSLKDMLVNLDNEDDMPALQSGSQSPPRGNNNNLADMDEPGMPGSAPDQQCSC